MPTDPGTTSVNDPTEVLLSFVIPAYNESEGIGRCVTSIRERAPSGSSFEVIVVDNGSTDGTPELAERAGARVVRSTAGTIGGVRNDGVRDAHGTVLVFLDADCALTAGWATEFERLLPRLRATPMVCAGSQVIPPPDEHNYLWRHWFTPFATQASASHVGSAHMILGRADFDAVGGFDTALSTGEDYDLCTRVKAAGGEIWNVPAMQVEHYGFPRTWGGFFRRERWHGRSDAASIVALLRSRVAVASLLFTGFSLMGLAGLVMGSPLAGLSLLGLALLVLLASAVVKFRHAGPGAVLAGMTVFPVYFLARAASVLDALNPQSAARRQRSARSS